MSRAEKFIEENTRNCSQLHYNSACTLRHCITPEHAREAVEIAREEAIEQTVEWLSKHAIKYYLDGSKFLGTDELVEDFKIAMRL